MPFPAGWPPRVASGRRSIRFFVSGLATANFSDNAFLFSQGIGANPFSPLPYVPPGGELAKAPATVIPPSPQGTGVSPQFASPQEGAVAPAMIWAFGIMICNDGGGPLSYSFDGTNVDGVVLASDPPQVFLYRHEAGIALQGLGVSFRVTAW
jgi:hypothetical protein